MNVYSAVVVAGTYFDCRNRLLDDPRLEGDGGMLSGIGCLMLLGPLGFVWAIHFLVHWFMGW